MVWNADINLNQELRANVDVEGFVWGAKVDSLLEKSGGEGYDVLILSDLVFNHSQVCVSFNFKKRGGIYEVALCSDRILQFPHIAQSPRFVAYALPTSLHHSSPTKVPRSRYEILQNSPRSRRRLGLLGMGAGIHRSNV